MKLQVPYKAGKFLLDEWLLASQEGLVSMELFTSLCSELPENTPHSSYKDQPVYVYKGPLNTVMNLRVPYIRRGISFLTSWAEWLLASQEGLFSIQLVTSVCSELPEDTPHPS
jgi:hypothetical protein